MLFYRGQRKCVLFIVSRAMSLLTMLHLCTFFQYGVWCLIWLGLNLFVISLYLEIGTATYVSMPLAKS